MCVLDRRDLLDLMHGRSRMAIDFRIPTMPGRSMSGLGGGEGGIPTTCVLHQWFSYMAGRVPKVQVVSLNLADFKMFAFFRVCAPGDITNGYRLYVWGSAPEANAA